MLANQQRAGATPDAQGSAPSQAPGRTTRTASLTSGGGDTTAPVGYLAGDTAIMDIDSDVELRAILARLEFMATFVDVGVGGREIIDELASLRARSDALASTLTEVQLERVRAQLHTTEEVVLAGMQERVVGAAEREEQGGVRENDSAGRDRIVEYAETIGWDGDVENSGGEVVWANGNFQWCGAFVGHNYVTTGGFDPELASAFSSAPSLVSFFEYRWGDRNPRHVEIDGVWVDVRDYHADRGSERQWWSAADIESLVATGGFAALPIRPGDIVIIDNTRAGSANHVAMVQSWDGAGGLVTVEGNTERLDGSSYEAVEDGIPRDQALQRTADGQGATRVRGIGRPSIVDLEVHTYDNTPPTP